MRDLSPSLLLCFGFFASSIGVAVGTAAEAGTIVSRVGDVDFLGGRCSATQCPLGSFDNRSLAEQTASDGSQLTDWSDSSFGLDLTIASFDHQYTPILGSILSASLRIGVAGVQTEPFTDALLVEGVEIADPFADQTNRGYEILTFALPNSVFASLLDGQAEVLLDFNQGGNEPVFLDFSELTLEFIEAPTPAVVGLFAVGGLALVAARRRWR